MDKSVTENHVNENESMTFVQLAMALADDYESVYVIDTDDDSYVEYAAAGEFKELTRRSEGDDFYADTVRNCNLIVYPDDRQKFLESFRKENVMAALDGGRSFTLNYRLIKDGVPAYYFLKTIRGKGRDVKHIIIGVQNVDAQVRREKAIAEENRRYSEIAGSLASLFEVIYLIDLNTGRYKEYSASSKFAELGIKSEGDDFFRVVKEQTVGVIHEDDYARVTEALQRSNMVKVLEKCGSFSLSYRQILDGRPQYVSLLAIRQRNTSDRVVIGIRNVDEQVQREMAYKQALGSAMDMANRDALTGVKNKHAYVQSEMEIDRLIAEDKCYDFAVLVADVNGLKQVNDTLGHHAGDEYIKAACKVICTTFKHSPVFRIGGDEFAVIMKGSDFEDREMLIEQLYEKMKANGSAGLVTAAAGKSEYIKGKDLRMQDVFERADNAMYEQKKLCRERRRE